MLVSAPICSRAAAEAKGFEVLVAEDIDRISRDQGDWHTARKRLAFLGIAVQTREQ